MRQYFLQLTGGKAPGPFDVYLSGSSGETLYQSDVSLVQLQAGISVELPDNVPSSSIVVYNNAYGCSNEVQVIFPTPPVSMAPTPTITPTITPTLSIVPSITPTITITPTISPTVTVSITPSISITPTRTITPTPTITPSITPSSPSSYNYYTLTPCSGGAGTDYRSILALALNDIVSFTDNPFNNACYQITSITASPNSNDLPTVYGRSGCGGSDCVQV
jgi:hypothetical protein